MPSSTELALNSIILTPISRKGARDSSLIDRALASGPDLPLGIKVMEAACRRDFGKPDHIALKVEGYAFRSHGAPWVTWDERVPPPETVHPLMYNTYAVGLIARFRLLRVANICQFYYGYADDLPFNSLLPRKSRVLSNVIRREIFSDLSSRLKQGRGFTGSSGLLRGLVTQNDPTPLFSDRLVFDPKNSIIIPPGEFVAPNIRLLSSTVDGNRTTYRYVKVR